MYNKNSKIVSSKPYLRSTLYTTDDSSYTVIVVQLVPLSFIPEVQLVPLSFIPEVQMAP